MRFRTCIVFLALFQSAALLAAEDATAGNSVKKWIEKLKSGGEDARVESARELVALGEAAIESLGKLIADPDAKPVAARQSVYILEKLAPQSDKAGVALIKALSSTNDSVHRAACEALTGVLAKGRPALLDDLVKRFEAAGAPERDGIVNVFAKSGRETLDYFCIKLFSENGELNKSVIPLILATVRKKSGSNLQSGGCLPPWPTSGSWPVRDVTAQIHTHPVELQTDVAQQAATPLIINMDRCFSGDPMTVTMELLPYLKNDDPEVRIETRKEIVRLNAYPPLTAAVLKSLTTLGDDKVRAP